MTVELHSEIVGVAKSRYNYDFYIMLLQVIFQAKILNVFFNPAVN